MLVFNMIFLLCWLLLCWYNYNFIWYFLWLLIWYLGYISSICTLLYASNFIYDS